MAGLADDCEARCPAPCHWQLTTAAAAGAGGPSRSPGACALATGASSLAISFKGEGVRHGMCCGRCQPDPQQQAAR